MATNRNYDVLVAELPRLRKFTRFLTGSVEGGDDLFQDSVERAVRSIEQLHGANSPRAWLFAIARNRFIDTYRRKTRQPDNVPLNEDIHAHRVTAGSTESDFVQDLSRAFANIPADLRDVMWLVAVEGFTYSEAADILDVPIGTIRSRVFRAREQLRDEMSDYWSDEP